MSRRRSAIPQPTDARAARIPSITAAELSTMWRACHRQYRSPSWFSSRTEREAEAGRFDLRAPRGTSYWADDPMGALYERLTDPDDLDALVPASVVASLRMWQNTPPPPSAAADTTARNGGLPKELGAGTDYRACWEWADKLDENDRQALVAWSRMAPNAARTIAVFGPSGAGPSISRTTSHSALEWLDDLIDTGLVADDPTLDELNIHPDAQPESGDTR